MPVRRRMRRPRRALRAFPRRSDETSVERGADRPRRHGHQVAVARAETGE